VRSAGHASERLRALVPEDVGAVGPQLAPRPLPARRRNAIEFISYSFFTATFVFKV
jgi:hypothetical protein